MSMLHIQPSRKFAHPTRSGAQIDRADALRRAAVNRSCLALAVIVATNAALVAGCLATVAEQSGRGLNEKTTTVAAPAGPASALAETVQAPNPGAQIAGARQRLAESNEAGRQKDEAARRAQAAIPSIDVGRTCRGSGGTLLGNAPTDSEVKQCMATEQSAREQIAGQWGEYTARDKARCVQTGVYLPSYVEWLTCLEMERDVRNMNRNPNPATSPR